MSYKSVRPLALVCAAQAVIGCGAGRSEAPPPSESAFTSVAPGGSGGGTTNGNEGDGEGDPGDAAGETVDYGALLELCAFADAVPQIVAETFVSPDDTLALSARDDGAMLSWVAFDAGQRTLSSLWFSDSTPLPKQIKGELAGDDSQPASAITEAGFVSVWGQVDDSVTGLYTRMVSSDGQAAAAPVRVTSDLAESPAPVVAEGADGRVLIVWLTGAERMELRAKLLDASGKSVASALPVAQPTDVLGKPALAQLGDGYVLGWVERATRSVMLQRLDREGAPSAEPMRIDADGDAEGRLSLATTDVGGAIAFDVRVAGKRAEVRARPFDLSGQPSGVERVVTESHEQGLSPQIVPFRGGFVVAYRSDFDGARALRLALLDEQTRRLDAEEVTMLNAFDLETQLAISPDGKSLHLAFTDEVAGSGAYELRRVSVECE